MTSCTKLIHVEEGELIVQENGLKIFDDIPEKDDVNLLFIFGNARSGKSFLLNCLFGHPGLFPVINQSLPCTHGVDISSSFLPYPKLADHFGISSEKKKSYPHIGFIDVEGQGEIGDEYDAKLALPLLLTSKIILFNHKGAPTVNDMLTKLAVLCRSAELIDGNIEFNDKQDKPKESNKKFNHLHICFRDFSFDSDQQTVYNQLMKFEVETESKQKNTQINSVIERNRVRHMLIDMFTSIHVWLFPQPNNHDILKSHNELPIDQIQKGFIDTLNNLGQCISQQCTEPSYFQQRRLNSAMFKTFFIEICDSINKHGHIHVPSIYFAMEKEITEKIMAECKLKYKEKVMNIRSQLPLGEETMLNQLETASLEITQYFDENLNLSYLKEKINDDKNKLLDYIEKIKNDIIQDNQKIVISLIKTLLSNLDTFENSYSTFRQNFTEWCGLNLPVSDISILENKYDQLKNQYSEYISSQISLIDNIENTSDYQTYKDINDQRINDLIEKQKLFNTNKLKDDSITIWKILHNHTTRLPLFFQQLFDKLKNNLESSFTKWSDQFQNEFLTDIENLINCDSQHEKALQQITQSIEKIHTKFVKEYQEIVNDYCIRQCDKLKTEFNKYIDAFYHIQHPPLDMLKQEISSKIEEQITTFQQDINIFQLSDSISQNFIDNIQKEGKKTLAEFEDKILLDATKNTFDYFQETRRFCKEHMDKITLPIIPSQLDQYCKEKINQVIKDSQCVPNINNQQFLQLIEDEKKYLSKNYHDINNIKIYQEKENIINSYYLIFCQDVESYLKQNEDTLKKNPQKEINFILEKELKIIMDKISLKFNNEYEGVKPQQLKEMENEFELLANRFISENISNYLSSSSSSDTHNPHNEVKNGDGSTICCIIS